MWSRISKLMKVAPKDFYFFEIVSFSSYLTFVLQVNDLQKYQAKSFYRPVIKMFHTLLYYRME